MCLLTTYSTLKCELCICTNRRLLPGSTKIRTKINPCLSKRNPWGTTRSHCWTTTLPWPTTSAKWSSHQALWPRFWANVLSPDFFVNGHLSSTSSFFTFFWGRKSSISNGPTAWKNMSLAIVRKQQLQDPDCRASFSPSLICISCWPGSLLENLPAARSKNRRSTSKNIDWRIKEANMFTKIHKTWTIRSPAAMPMPEALDCTKVHHRMVESSTKKITKYCNFQLWK